MARVNYAFTADGLHGTVFPTMDEADDDTIFATFTEAKNALASWFSFVATAYHGAAKAAREMRLSDVNENLARLGGPDGG